MKDTQSFIDYVYYLSLFTEFFNSTQNIHVYQLNFSTITTCLPLILLIASPKANVSTYHWHKYTQRRVMTTMECVTIIAIVSGIR